ncbi:MAG: nitroreductase family protein, partial [Candidatus Neomarinimicrobiota bacterium]
IRQATEAEEKENYARRMPPEWLQALEPLGTGWQKPYLEIAPWLVVVFQQNYRQLPDGERRNNYYVTESVGIAVGMFIAAVHQAGLVCLPHTPSPMGFLSQILERLPNEKPFVLIPVGYPADDCRVPNIKRKSLAEIAVFRDG